MTRFKRINLLLFIFSMMFLLFFAGMSKISQRVGITFIGYKLGELKKEEKILLQETAELENELSSLMQIYKLKEYSKKILPNNSKPLLREETNE